MKVLELNTSLTIELVPRELPNVGDVINCELRREFNDQKKDENVTFTIVKDRLVFSLLGNWTNFLKWGEKHEIIVKNKTTNKTIYIGKLLVVKENTDIQNYTPSNQKTQKLFKTKS